MIAKRILAMVAALSIISNNSVPIALAHTGMDNDHEERSQDKKVESDNTPTDEEDKDGQTSSDEDEANELKLNVEPSDKWVKTLENWEVNYDPCELIYFKTSSEMFEPKESDISPENFFWGGEALPQGDNYVCFYAKNPDTGKVRMSKVYHYKLDSKQPENFELLLKQNKVKDSDNDKTIETYDIINKEPLCDNESDISCVYYSVGEELKNDWEILKKGKKLNLTDDPEKGHDICLRVEDHMKGKTVYFYAFDMCGNKSMATRYIDVKVEKAVPKCKYLGTVNINNGKETPVITKAYGHEAVEDHPYTNYTYTGDASYIKVKMYDYSRDKCSVIFNWYEDEGEKGRIISLSKLHIPNGITPENDVFYIPFSELELNDGNYKFIVSVGDDDSNSAEEALSDDFYYSKTIKEDDLLAEIKPHDDTDNFTPDQSKNPDGVDAYLKDSEENGNKLVIDLEDDLGIAGYKLYIKKNGQDFKKISEDLSIGESKTVTVGENTEDENEETYYLPIKNYSIDPIVLDENGIYSLRLIVRDIEGNERIYDRKYVVDDAAPTIDGATYTADPELNYNNHGIFSSKEVQTITIKVAENVCNNIDPDDIVLYIVNENGQPKGYKPKLAQGGYTFSLESNISGKAYITVTDKAKNSNTYYFKGFENNDDAGKEERLLLKDPSEELDPEKAAKLVVCKDPPVINVESIGGKKGFIDVDNKQYYIFGDSPDNELFFTLHDDNGLVSHNIDIIKKDEKDEPEIEINHNKLYDKENIVHDDSFTIPIEDLPTGKYDITGNVINLPGINVAVQGLGDRYSAFCVDKTGPSIIDTQYKIEKAEDSKQVEDSKIFKNIKTAKIGKDEDEPSYLTFRNYGIFGHEKINISIDVSDGKYGCGVEGAKLYWGDIEYTGVLDDKGKCVFSGIEPVYKAEPKITVWDKFDNTSTYYFTANSLGKNIGELIIEEPETADRRVSLTMEDGKPLVQISVENGIKIKEEQWYSDDVSYKVVARDNGVYRSGLKEVKIKYDGTNIKTENIYDGVNFEDVQFLGFAEFSDEKYTITEEGHHILVAEAVDNAGNSFTDTRNINIDKTNPEITAFTINGIAEMAPFVHEGTYGYFFENDATVRVYVNDPGASEGKASGIASVQLYKSEAGGNAIDWTVDSSMLKSDEHGQYAEFVIHKGFKGHIAAEVTDNVGHSSQKLGPDGAVVEDDQLHSEHASVTITPLGTPVNGIYNHELALNVTVKDTFSGISDINWSIGKDKKSGNLKASTYDMSLTSDQPVDEKIISTDANLITEVSFQLLVETDDLDNPVNITMTDNAGNTTTSSALYSLDLTAPVVSTSLGNGDAKNGIYYDKEQQVNLSIVEKNFNEADAKVLVNGVEQKVAWNSEGATHTSTVDLKDDGEYTIKVEYNDMAGNPGTYDPGQHFIIDKTKPVITNNFADFKTGTPDEVSGSTELYYNNQGDRKASFEINVTEKNFIEEDLNIKVFSKSAGSSHKEQEGEEWFETRPEYTWTHNTAKDSHRLTFDLDEDSVYKIEIDPVDRAGNAGEIAEGSDSKTDIFEVDTTAPVLGARNEGDYSELTEDKYNALAIYDIDRFEEEAPYVEFTDTNLYRLEYERTSFKPTYSGGREIGKIRPEEKKSDEDYSDFEKDEAIDIKKSEKGLEQDVIRYTVPDFDEDGVYSVKLYAVDMAGNKSEISDNTYVRMMNTSMLAYIENSSRINCTGWYSFEDEEYGPISKQPTSFEDLDIVMFSKAGSSPKLLLVDKDTEAETDTCATASGESIIEDEIFMVDATKYRLSGEYFAANYTEDTDTRLYLRAENNGEYVDLGEMYIDNTKPDCAVPDYLSNWGWLRGSGEKTITFSNISEILDADETVVYINGQEVTANGLQATVDGKIVSAAYNAETDQLSVILPSGTYSIGAKLVDKAGNMRIISEVEHFSVGNRRIWLGASGAAMLIVTVGGVTVVARSRRRKLYSK